MSERELFEHYANCLSTGVLSYDGRFVGEYTFGTAVRTQSLEIENDIYTLYDRTNSKQFKDAVSLTSSKLYKVLA